MSEDLVEKWLTVPEVADQLGVSPTRVRQMVGDHQLLAVRRGENSALMVPADLIHGGKPLKGLAGVLTLLADARYTDEEMLRWLYTPDESLPGSPVEALAGNRGTEVKRRAQALGF